MPDAVTVPRRDRAASAVRAGRTALAHAAAAAAVPDAGKNGYETHAAYASRYQPQAAQALTESEGA